MSNRVKILQKEKILSNSKMVVKSKQKFHSSINPSLGSPEMISPRPEWEIDMSRNMQLMILSRFTRCSSVDYCNRSLQFLCVDHNATHFQNCTNGRDKCGRNISTLETILNRTVRLFLPSNPFERNLITSKS